MELPARWDKMNDEEKGKWFQMMASKYQKQLDDLKKLWAKHINVKWPKNGK